MHQVELQRFRRSDHGTFGIFVTEGFWCWSLELPWRDNTPNLSCIPHGEYLVECSFSPAFKRRLYLVNNVPNRGGIRIHSGNFAGDKTRGLRTHSAGCILLGTRLGTIRGQKAVILSEPKVSGFMRHMGEQPFILRIKEDF